MVGSLIQVLSQFFIQTFLPRGYPHSVSCDYTTYQLWDSVQAFCSGINTSLATNSILISLGVGRKRSSALSASLNWILKDGCGLLGRIAFAYITSTKLDANTKQWRLFADVMNDVSIFLSILTQTVHTQYLSLLLIASSLTQACVGVAGPATRASIIKHQAKGNNIADISAKDSSQETVVNLFALVASVFILPIVHDKVHLTWLIFLLLVSLHIFSNYKAVTCIQFNTINLSRYHLLVKTFVHCKRCNSSSFLPQDREALSLKCINKSECIFFNSCYLKHITTFDSQKEGKHFEVILKIREQTVLIMFHYKCRKYDLLKAFFQAEYICNKLKDEFSFLTKMMVDENNIIKDSQFYTEKHFDEFYEIIKVNGWEMDIMY